MKKLFSLILCLLLVSLLTVPALAAGDAPVITMQPQNYTYPEYSVAIFTVKATGTNLRATWYLAWNGATYNLSDNENGQEPWEAYAGESYGANKPDDNTFTFFFGGIEAELSGGQIWCVIDDGHYDVTTQKAFITVSGDAMPPEILDMPAERNVEQGDEAELRCLAKSPDGSQLAYTWYETETGNMQDIRAIDRGSEDSDFLFCDTSQIGTRYYVCMVQTTNGGMVYSSIVPVTVTEKSTETPPANTDDPVTPDDPASPGGTETETQPAESTAPTEEKGSNGGNNDPSGIDWWIIVLVAAGGIGAGAVVALLIVKKKPKQ